MFTFFGDSRRRHRDGTPASCGKPRSGDRQTDRQNSRQAAREARLNTKAFVILYVAMRYTVLRWQARGGGGGEIYGRGRPMVDPYMLNRKCRSKPYTLGP